MSLQKGYTTGVHTSFAFKSALDIFIATRDIVITKTTKMFNDDLDVTKGCTIVVTISNKQSALKLNPLHHNPYIIRKNNNILNLFAGVGVGVVTKDGLKPPKGYPAINPVPLKAIEDIFTKHINSVGEIFCSIGVEDGEDIAKNTANSKVGVIGGISILGTTGWVKPISATAYIDSIDAELNYAKANGYKKIIFTLGNSAFKKVSNRTDGYIIEIGNFIYDGISLAISHSFETIELYLGVAKAIKISQGFKNTHNRFGSIDFAKVQKLVDIDIKDCLTIKRVKELLGENADNFDNIAKKEAMRQLKLWFNKDIKVTIC